MGDPLTPFQLHALYVIFWAILSVFYSWPEHGSMFSPPTIREVTVGAKKKQKSPPKSESRQSLKSNFFTQKHGDSRNAWDEDTTPTTHDATPGSNVNLVSVVPS